MNRDVSITKEQARQVREIVQTVDPDDSELLADMIEGETDFESVLFSLCEAHDSAKAHAAALTERINSMQARKERMRRQMDAAKAGMLALMDAAGLRKWTLPEWTPHVAERTVVRAAPDADPALLPDDLVRTKREPDKAAINAAVDEGRNVPGYFVERVRGIRLGRT